MNDFPGIPDDERGLVPKYAVFKMPSNYTGQHNVEGTLNGLAMEAVAEPCFVLKFSDRHARVALEAYAKSCDRQHPRLASDIRRKLLDTSEEALAGGLEELRARLSHNEGIMPGEML